MLVVPVAMPLFSHVERSGLSNKNNSQQRISSKNTLQNYQYYLVVAKQVSDYKRTKRIHCNPMRHNIKTHKDYEGKIVINLSTSLVTIKDQAMSYHEKYNIEFNFKFKTVTSLQGWKITTINRPCKNLMMKKNKMKY